MSCAAVVASEVSRAPQPTIIIPAMAAATTSEGKGQTTTGDHELENIADKKPTLPVEEDLMQLARLGEIGAIQKLFDSGKYDATYKDEQGITPLHVRIIH